MPDGKFLIPAQTQFTAYDDIPGAIKSGSIQVPDLEHYQQNLLAAQKDAARNYKTVSGDNSNWTFLGPKQTFWLNESGSQQAPSSCPWQVNVYSFDVSASDNNIIYVGTETGFVNKTTDNGFTWLLCGQGYPFGGAATAVAIHPGDPDLVYVSAGNQIHKTMDGGQNWTLLATGQTDNFQMNNGQGYFDLVLAVSPIDENLIFAGTTTLFKSQNGGARFTAIGGYFGAFSIHPDIQDIKMLPSGITWVSTDGGMTITDDNFTATSKYYVRINGIVGSDMWGFDQGWNEDLVVGGRYHNGNTAIADFYNDKALRMGGAESPTGWVLQGRSRHVAFNDLGNGWILPEEAAGEPEGRFIFSKYPNMEEYGGRRSNLVAHPNYYGIIYLGEGKSIWRSSDMGVTYERIYTFPGEVLYMQISYSHPDILYVDVVDRGLYKSEDGGYTWTAKPNLTRSPYGSTYWKGKLFFAISPYEGNTIYACLQNGTWSADLGKVSQGLFQEGRRCGLDTVRE